MVEVVKVTSEVKVRRAKIESRATSIKGTSRFVLLVNEM
jgi:hypothetical protein